MTNCRNYEDSMIAGVLGLTFFFGVRMFGSALGSFNFSFVYNGISLQSVAFSISNLFVCYQHEEFHKRVF